MNGSSIPANRYTWRERQAAFDAEIFLVGVKSACRSFLAERYRGGTEFKAACQLLEHLLRNAYIPDGADDVFGQPRQVTDIVCSGKYSGQSHCVVWVRHKHYPRDDLSFRIEYSEELFVP